MPTLAETIKNETQRLACAVLSDVNARAQYLARAATKIPGGSIGGAVATAPVGLLTEFACGGNPATSKPGDLLTGEDGIDGQPPSGFNFDSVGGANITFKNASGVSQNVSTRQFTYTLGQFGWEATSRRCDGAVAAVGSFQPGSIVINSTGVCFAGTEPLPDFTYDDRPRYRGPVTYDGPNGPITEDVDIVLDDPEEDDGGGWTFPFFWVSPTLDIKPDLNLDVEPEIDFSPDDLCGPDIDLPSLDLDDQPDDPEPPDDETLLAGVVVTTTRVTTERTTGIFQDGNAPSIYLPRCAVVVFAVNVGGVKCWTKPVDVETLRAWVPFEGEIYPYDAVVKSALGFESELTKIYIKGKSPDEA